MQVTNSEGEIDERFKIVPSINSTDESYILANSWILHLRKGQGKGNDTLPNITLAFHLDELLLDYMQNATLDNLQLFGVKGR